MAIAVKITSAPKIRLSNSARFPIKEIFWKNQFPPYAIRSMGRLDPKAYAAKRMAVLLKSPVVAASVTMVPRIGPAHGVQMIPKETPTRSPETTPFFFKFFEETEAPSLPSVAAIPAVNFL